MGPGGCPIPFRLLALCVGTLSEWARSATPLLSFRSRRIWLRSGLACPSWSLPFFVLLSTRRFGSAPGPSGSVVFSLPFSPRVTAAPFVLPGGLNPRVALPPLFFMLAPWVTTPAALRSVLVDPFGPFWLHSSSGCPASSLFRYLVLFVLFLSVAGFCFFASHCSSVLLG